MNISDMFLIYAVIYGALLLKDNRSALLFFTAICLFLSVYFRFIGK